jgi:signal recognition particle GTPase
MSDMGLKNVIILSGNAGSGKTEFALQYALSLARSGRKVNIVDLDIINVYYRSRENQRFLESQGIGMWGSTNFEYNGSDLPAVSLGFEPLLHQRDEYVILDLAGTRNGLKLLMALREKNFPRELWLVLNIYRTETDSVQKIVNLAREYADFSGFAVTGLVNNSNLLGETGVENVREGERVIGEAAKTLGIPVVMTMALERLNYQGEAPLLRIRDIRNVQR